ncbi:MULTISPECIES: alpha-L-fucosidase [unclassified Lentimonas]|uniref:alpha-L-fucosidase n=1 Tax=unclassified Lentimonas TaxID=2630993 RepID=UPI001326EB75|nr:MULTISPECIES: alpha-L-fucosidase [unclassified Lentimonas]CAA6677804.1 Alpha-L-fucosidase (EC [Lentimonas sp. CC4]CAA6683906.1 Alpha-L-fucosidase (EC [Lentimonas sp. CC6]CAA7076716.1 Alpha-L-fucosidase (EC [Lentimonas sp. CC4]CAA7169949.1 Alpha-L-fucosidase (EC [Lentimonas sp. CC21]CAA7181238.1 Alpha-L-fucosidase (EC [Lentimonas sp. CC8]
MKRLNISLKLLIITLGIALHTVVSAQVVPAPSADKSTGRAAWLDEAKYGMFIHWGVYSTLAKGEWVMSGSKIPVVEYKEMASKFNPVKFDAEEWVAVAKNAGMKYITITSKHHDGFAMFDSEVTDYNIVDYTPFKRDVLQELKEACDNAGIKLGFYYSQTQDWEFPGGAGRKWDPAQKGDFRNYIDTKALPQLKELMTNYEPTHIWFDTPFSNKGKNTSPELAKEFVDVIREADPDTIINSRLMFHGNQVEGLKPEQYETLKEVGVDFLSYRDRTIPPHSPWEYWETCMTLNDAWGYRANDHNWKTSQMVIMQLVEVVSKGGTFLLNVGPTAEGEIPAPAIAILESAGEWLKVNSESVYGAEETIFEGSGDYIKLSAKEQATLEKDALATGAGKGKKGHKQKDYAWLATGREGKLYLHFFQWPIEPFELEGFDADKVTNAYFLADPGKSPVQFTQTGGTVKVTLPAKPLDELNTVLCLTLD